MNQLKTLTILALSSCSFLIFSSSTLALACLTSNSFAFFAFAAFPASLSMDGLRGPVFEVLPFAVLPLGFLVLLAIM